MHIWQNSVRIRWRALRAQIQRIPRSVIANVDAKMVKPPPERPLEGIISIHSEISPMASVDHELGR